MIDRYKNANNNAAQALAECPMRLRKASSAVFRDANAHKRSLQGCGELSEMGSSLGGCFRCLQRCHRAVRAHFKASMVAFMPFILALGAPSGWFIRVPQELAWDFAFCMLFC